MGLIRNIGIQLLRDSSSGVQNVRGCSACGAIANALFSDFRTRSITVPMSSASDTTSGNALVDRVREWLRKLSLEIYPGGMLPLSQKKAK